MDQIKNKITKLLSTKNQERVNIYIDGEYLFTVEKSLVVDYGLSVGKGIDDETYQELVLKDFQSRIYNKALNKLAVRAHSKYELKSYLQRTVYKNKAYIIDKISEDKIDGNKISTEIISKLEDQGYLDDREFSRLLINSKINKKSEFEIKRKLMEKGVNSDIANEVMCEFVFDNDDIIIGLIEKKKRQLEHKDLTEKQLNDKIIQFLMRKGYRYQEIVDKL